MIEGTRLKKKNLFIHQIWAFAKEIHIIIEHVHVKDHTQFSSQKYWSERFMLKGSGPAHEGLGLQGGVVQGLVDERMNQDVVG